MRCYGESGVIGVILDKFPNNPDYGHLDKNANKKRETPVLRFYQKNQVLCPVQFGLRNPKLVSGLKSDLGRKNASVVPICPFDGHSSCI